jgi:LytTr DNA-binding domain
VNSEAVSLDQALPDDVVANSSLGIFAYRNYPVFSLPWLRKRSLLVRASAIERVKRDDLGKYHLHLKGQSEVLPVSGAFQHRFKSM